MSRAAKTTYAVLIVLFLVVATVTAVFYRQQVNICSTIIIVMLGLAIGAVFAREDRLFELMTVWIAACGWVVLSLLPGHLLTPRQMSRNADVFWLMLHWCIPALVSVLVLPLIRFLWEQFITARQRIMDDFDAGLDQGS